MFNRGQRVQKRREMLERARRHEPFDRPRAEAIADAQPDSQRWRTGRVDAQLDRSTSLQARSSATRRGGGRQPPRERLRVMPVTREQRGPQQQCLDIPRH